MAELASEDELHRQIVLKLWLDNVKSSEWTEYFRNYDRAVGALVVFQDGANYAVSKSGGRNGMDETLVTGGILVADIQTAGLKFGQIGVGSDFAIAIVARIPCLNVVFFVGWSPEVATP